MSALKRIVSGKPFPTRDPYREVVEVAAAYNVTLLRNRQSRLPYFDTHTATEQRPCYLWMTSKQRQKGIEPGQIYSYAAIRYKRKKRIDSDTFKQRQLSSSDIANVGNKITCIQKVKSRNNSDTDDEPDDFDSPDVVTEKVNDIIADESNIMPIKERNCVKKVKAVGHHKPIDQISQMDMNIEEKPYACDLCGRRYKNAPGLKYHYIHAHNISKFTRESGRSLKPTKIVPSIDRVKQNLYCDFCLGDVNLNKKTGQAERLISCADCGRSGHPTCLQFTPSLTETVLMYAWQCIECKSCSICGTSDNDDKLLFCDDCDRGYHMYCLSPPIEHPPEGHWACNVCLKN